MNSPPGNLGNIVLLVCFAPLLLFARGAHAHGSVTIDEDLCVIQIGYAQAHFKAYLPRDREHRDYCEDLPGVGETVFVMEYTSTGFDRAPVDFRVIRDIIGLGRFVKWQDVAAIEPDELEAATVFYRPPVIEPDVFTVLHTFEEAGEFVGVVTAKHPESDTMYTAVFPFKVGFTGFGYLPLFVGLVLAVQLNYFFMTGGLARWRKRRARGRVRNAEQVADA